MQKILRKRKATKREEIGTTLGAYSFPILPPDMLPPEHHWHDYPSALRDRVNQILLLAPAAPVTSISNAATSIATPATATDVKVPIAAHNGCQLHVVQPPQKDQPQTTKP
uniref:Uncharacterized protein n=1 Tax=Romanomermis culicivorax TaxID=13658 RepID=A0A915HP70_ROMCU